jgi:ABC-2 type transport system permease protein
MSNTSTKAPRAAFGKLLLNETRLARRVPIGLGLGLGLPILLLIIFGSIPAVSKPSHELGGLSYFDISFPILIGMTVLSLSTMVLPRSLVSYRETGVLRRLSTTPVPPSWLLAAQVVVNLVMTIAGLAMLTIAGIAAFGLGTPRDWPGFLLSALLTISSLFAIGLWIAAIARNNAAANGIGGLLFYVMLFFGGLWVPREIMPTILRNISDWTPMGAAIGAIQNAMQGISIPLHLLLILAGYTIVFGYLSVRYFKWE